ncbi:hypothetical protein [Amycolatopsis tolypomycina]|uniref:hypothetical protein n=1 Tax=Amycolatopsis tolypomycina TaxID=208445 RepID=UPI0033A2B500
MDLADVATDLLTCYPRLRIVAAVLVDRRGRTRPHRNPDVVHHAGPVVRPRRVGAAQTQILFGMHSTDSSDVTLFAGRARVYARCAFALRSDPNAVGAESLFDAALSNGLAIVVGSGWRGEEFVAQKPNKPGKPKVKFARSMLELLGAKARSQETTPADVELVPPQVRVDAISAQWDAAGEDAKSVTLTVTQHLTVPPEQHRPASEVEREPFAPRAHDHAVVRIETATLLEAIDIANAIRHGNESRGELEQRHLDALFALDEHPRLRGLLDEQIDAHQRGDSEADSIRAGIAQEYLSLLDNDEIARRVEAAGWYAPAPGDVGESLQDCPVCDQETLIPDGGVDDFGAGIVAGTCFVCGYRRSREQADREAWSIVLDRRDFR